jgi:hypothetical protein
MNSKTLYKFELKNKEDKPLFRQIALPQEDNDWDLSYKPREILEELYAAITDFYKSSEKMMFSLLDETNLDENKLKLIFNINENKKHDKLFEFFLKCFNYDMDSLEKLNKERISLLITIINNTEKEIKKEAEKQKIVFDVQSTLKKLENIKKIYENNYDFTDRYDFSFLDFLKNSKIFNANSTFADFRNVYKNYDTLLKLFNKKQFPDDQKIFDLSLEKMQKTYSLFIQAMKSLRTLFYTKDKKEKPFFEIDFVLNRIIYFIKNNLSKKNFFEDLKNKLNKN